MTHHLEQSPSERSMDMKGNVSRIYFNYTPSAKKLVSKLYFLIEDSIITNKIAGLRTNQIRNFTTLKVLNFAGIKFCDPRIFLKTDFSRVLNLAIFKF